MVAIVTSFRCCRFRLNVSPRLPYSVPRFQQRVASRVVDSGTFVSGVQHVGVVLQLHDNLATSTPDQRRKFPNAPSKAEAVLHDTLAERENRCLEDDNVAVDARPGHSDLVDGVVAGFPSRHHFTGGRRVELGAPHDVARAGRIHDPRRSTRGCGVKGDWRLDDSNLSRHHDGR